ncbi:MAG: metal-dependent phosphohydrolase [Deltaproteobacteria bacterium]|nr:metal-dependent phosphohydrolase [Deltaproteobacteria bacterium]
MPDTAPKISIDQLVDIVNNGGKVRTGVDIFNKQGRLILEKDVLVTDAIPLLNVKKFGIGVIPIVNAGAGGMWDKDGNSIESPASFTPAKAAPTSEIDRRINEISEIRTAASQKYEKARGCIKNVLTSIQDNGGHFDFAPIEDTVSGLFAFISQNDNAFSYLTREIFSYDDYLYNHSINVCTIGTVVLKKFAEKFGAAVNKRLHNSMADSGEPDGIQFRKCFTAREMRDISIGFFMHDIGKILVDKEVLNKEGKLTADEFEIVKEHSLSKGPELFAKNSIDNPFICKIGRLHHARLFNDEKRCYPADVNPADIPSCVKICKLADIYDAMTSRRVYKEAMNPVGVVADIFHKYAHKDNLLQLILHAFVEAVGIYPPGSVVSLTNGQAAYVFDGRGPVLIPITDTDGQPLNTKQDIMVLDKSAAARGLEIDRRKPPLTPVAAHKIMPAYLKKSLYL